LHALVKCYPQTPAVLAQMTSGLAGQVSGAENPSPSMRWSWRKSATAHAPAAKRQMRRQR